MNDHATECNEQFTVYVVDDDPDVRDALNLLLQLRGYRTALFDSAESFLRVLRPDIAGCLITDIRMPGMSGLELQQELAKRCVQLPVVVLTAHGDVTSARNALRAHAVDFLMKPFHEADLTAAIDVALQRERARLAALETETADRTLVANLTRREREVLQLLVKGMTNEEIAAKLILSSATVRLHVSNVLMKLHAANRTTAAVIAVENRLV